MEVKKKLLLVSAVVVVLALQFTFGSSSSSYWGFNCAGGNFTPGSPYDRRLDAVAALLPGGTASSPLLFNSSSEAAGEATLYAVAQCRGDRSIKGCRRCLTGAFKLSRVLCGFSEGAVVYRSWCTIGYYNTNLSVLSPEDISLDTLNTKADESPVTIQSSTFDAALVDLMKGVAPRTAASPGRFAKGQMNFTGPEFEVKIYALAQCPPTLSAEDCDTCLGELFETILAQNLTAGRAARLWCNFRFAPQSFFSGMPMVDIAVNGSTLPGAVEEKHKHCKHTLLWVTAALGAVVAILVIADLIGLVFWCRKRRLPPQPEVMEPEVVEPDAVEPEGQHAALEIQRRRKGKAPAGST